MAWLTVVFRADAQTERPYMRSVVFRTVAFRADARTERPYMGSVVFRAVVFRADAQTERPYMDRLNRRFGRHVWGGRLKRA